MTGEALDGRRASGPTSRERILLFAAPPLAAFAPLWHAYVNLDLPHRFESAAVAAGVLLIALALGAALAALRGHRHPLAKPLEVVLLLVALLFVLDLMRYSSEQSIIWQLALVRPLYFVAILGVAAVLLWLVRSQATSIFFVGAAALAISGFVLQPPLPAAAGAAPAELAAAPASAGPPLVYVVLDEMIAPEAIPLDIAGGEATYEAIRSLFGRHGFRLYGQAFSRHALTVVSIPNTLNYDASDNGAGIELRHAENGIVHSALLDDIAEQMPLVVYQSAHIDFCGPLASRCETLPSFDPLSSFAKDTGLPPGAALGLLRKATKGSLVATALADLLAASHGWPITDAALPTYFDVHAFPRWFDKFEADVVGSAGRASYFAHLLSPHAPYLLDAGCELQSRWELPYNLRDDLHLEGEVLEAARVRNYTWYFQQIGCLLSELESLLSRLDRDPAFEDATLVFHGDHGSRISAGRLAETVTDRDVIDDHAALFAIRGPAIEPGYDLRKVSIQQLAAEYFGGKSVADFGADQEKVVIDSETAGASVLRDMPDFARPVRPVAHD
jgi:hypothetical protein